MEKPFLRPASLRGMCSRLLVRFRRLQRFSLRFKLVSIIPIVTYFTVFKFYPEIPFDARQAIDQTTLAEVDDFLTFGNGALLQFFPRSVVTETDETRPLLQTLDMLAAFIYFIHFGAFVMFTGFLYLFYRKRRDESGKPIPQPWLYLWTLGILNVLALVIQMAWPTAPPWYQESYGDESATYGVQGSAAGLVRADEIMSMPLFSGIYGAGTLVFASFPSLHGAWPIIIAWFIPGGPVAKVFASIYVAWVWWAAMYLNHHFLADLLGSAAFCAVSIWLGSATMHWRIERFQFEQRCADDNSLVDRVSECDPMDAVRLEIELQSTPPPSRNNKASLLNDLVGRLTGPSSSPYSALPSEPDKFVLLAPDKVMMHESDKSVALEPDNKSVALECGRRRASVSIAQRDLHQSQTVVVAPTDLRSVIVAC
eukprot:TRINITY_DN27695_c0_g1_i1.p1 TRINITY_DN27695_c0_g1~~TRINITY_DN27695_c0_g1_i1.p1  ORF type:complete len:424 (-),score=68.61 TRINITY_DN27695_c0_g1_i1:162-1433(-)